MKTRLLTFFVLTVLFISIGFIAGCQNQPGDEAEESDKKSDQTTEKSKSTELLGQAQKLFKPLPEPADFDRPVAKLGKQLYYETNLSISNKISCNSCHMLDNYGVDNEATSLGHDKKTRGERNSPSVYNAFLHVSQFWDGRAEDLVEQAKGPVLNPIEMGMPDQATVMKKLGESEQYKNLFKQAFPNEEKPVSFQNMAVAIAEFEKTLATPSDFDKYLEGDKKALTEEERQGLETFIKVGCTNCHTGPALGAQIYQKFGLIEGPYWEHTGSAHIDSGRYLVTGESMDKFVFKVPSLRNVAKTQPYFHDGSVKELSEAIKIMGTTQLGRELSEEEVKSIEAFLNSLTGEIPEYALQKGEGEMASL